MSTSALPKGSLVLVIGVTGTIGVAVADEALKAGFKVRAPIRNAEKGEIVAGIFNKRHGPDVFSTVLIPDMTQPGALDEAMQGVAGVVNLASEMSFSPDPNKIITPSLALVNNLLSSAAKTPSVKRFVFTSSSAVLPKIREPGTITGASWLPESDKLVEYAWAEPYTPDKAPVVYPASKIVTEKACFEFVEKEKPGFVLNTVIPGFAVGDVYDPRLISSSNGAVLGTLSNHPFGVAFISGISPASFVNVQDAALLHLAALTAEDLSNQRLLALGGIFDLNQLVDLLVKIAPDSTLPPKAEFSKPQAIIDTTREVELLKRFGKSGFTGFDDSVKQLLSSASGKS